MILPPERRLNGLAAATFTPLREDGSLNLDLVPAIVDRLERDGVVAIFVLGSTGEGTSLTAEERRAVAEAYVEAARGRLATIVHVGHHSVAEARRFAEHAQEIGANAISAVAPWYFRPTDERALARTLAEIACGAPETPFYYYHIPSLTGVDPDLRVLLEEAEEHVPTLVGIKFTDPRLHELLGCMRARNGAYDVVFGVDEMLLGAWAFGVRGAVGSTYSFAAPLYLRMITAFEAGDIESARSCQALATEMVRIILTRCGRGGLKAMMALIGLDCGPPRLPQVAPDRRAVEEMKQALEAIGFFEWVEAPEAALAPEGRMA